jgi:hypothetical protein
MTVTARIFMAPNQSNERAKTTRLLQLRTRLVLPLETPQRAWRV